MGLTLAFGAFNFLTLIRTPLTLVLCFYLYLGAPAARWFAMLGFGFGGAVGFASESLVLQVFGVTCAAFVLLLFSGPVDAYFR